MPTTEPKQPQTLIPPHTRVTNQWALLVRVLTRDNPKRLRTVRTLGAHVRRKR